MLKLTRTVTPDECSWLDRTYFKNEVVYKFGGCTYGCISPNGIACSEDGETPFFELPINAVKEQ
jgi:hypothetical protein